TSSSGWPWPTTPIPRTSTTSGPSRTGWVTSWKDSMTSSEDTALPPSAITDVAEIVGTSYGGEPSGPARVALVCAKFNGAITARLVHGALAGLRDHAVDMSGVDVAWVPGAVELPLAAS